jgi:6-phosphogluconolactonase
MSDAAPKLSDEERNPTFVYVGTYTTGGKSQGIHLFRLQTKNLDVSQNITLVPLGLAAEAVDPSFLELDLRRRLVFAVSEAEEGAVSAFKVGDDGRLTLLNQRPSMGKRPSHLVLDGEGKNLLVANADNVAVVPVESDGRLGTAAVAAKGTLVQGVVLDVAGRFAFVCDSAADKVLGYRFDGANGTLTVHAPASISVKAGAAPRHMVFRPDGKFAYVANERGSTVTAFAYDGAAGLLKETQTVSTLPEYFDGPNTAAEVAVHPTGKYLYVSNRGHNSVVLFRIDPEAGTLTYVEEQGTGGRTPRHFGIEPGAKHLAIANQDSDTVLASRIDAGNGRLKPSGVFASAPSPACVKFLPPPEAAP